MNRVEHREYRLVGHVPLASSRKAPVESHLNTIHGQLLNLCQKHLRSSHRSYRMTTARSVTDLIYLLDRVHHSC